MSRTRSVNATEIVSSSGGGSTKSRSGSQLLDFFMSLAKGLGTVVTLPLSIPLAIVATAMSLTADFANNIETHVHKTYLGRAVIPDPLFQGVAKFFKDLRNTIAVAGVGPAIAMAKDFYEQAQNISVANGLPYAQNTSDLLSQALLPRDQLEARVKELSQIAVTPLSPESRAQNDASIKLINNQLAASATPPSNNPAPMAQATSPLTQGAPESNAQGMSSGGGSSPTPPKNNGRKRKAGDMRSGRG